MQTEGARARDQQEKELKHFEGKNAIGTLSQLVSTRHSVEKREVYSHFENISWNQCAKKSQQPNSYF